jgi:hypothetical protein
MEHVVVRWEPEQGGYWVDPRAYQAVLADMAASLPEGAREFALDPQHYDFASDRCVKDLWFRSLEVDDAAGTARLSFGPNNAKHTVGLHLEYCGVVSVGISRDRDPGVGWLGSLLLDELRPSPDGVIHEFALTGGSLHVVAEDVKATWG